MVTAFKTTFGLYIPKELFLVDKYVVQQSISPCWFLYHLGQKAVIDAVQEQSREEVIPCLVFQQISR